MNWTPVWQYAISGAIVSWPVFLVGLWFSHRKQSETTQQITDAQTMDLVKKLKDDA